MKTESNVEQAVPFLFVSNIGESIRYYVDGLGFEMTNKWLDEGKLRPRGIQAGKPFVGNGMWVVSLSDPDGYKISFQSQTDVPEETECRN